jgi:hypothetical protein
MHGKTCVLTLLLLFRIVAAAKNRGGRGFFYKKITKSVDKTLNVFLLCV